MISARIIGNFEAIGSHWWLGVYENLADARADKLVAKAVAEADKFNRAYSRFLPDSLVSKLNRDRRLANPPAELIAMIKAGESARVASGGAFNLGVGAHLEQLGYGVGYQFIEGEASPAQTSSAFTTIASHLIELAPGPNIDLGGLGKGWLIDHLAGLLEHAGVTEILVNGGGDIAVRGHLPKRFAIENPFKADEAIGEIIIASGGLAASAPNRRTWTASNTGRHHHHLINPATGLSHAGPAAVHTFATTTTNADIASTALYVMPPDQAAAFASTMKVDYLIVGTNGEASASTNYPGQLYS